jgi:hypothetical protein
MQEIPRLNTPFIKPNVHLDRAWDHKEIVLQTKIVPMIFTATSMQTTRATNSILIHPVSPCNQFVQFF